jgi:integrase
MFGQAVRWEMMPKSPFDGMKVVSQKNRDRLRFIPADVCQRVMAQMPDKQWKLLFALSRWGGLRCPSEHLALKWSDVDFEHGRIRVTCVKTAHHEGHAERTIPIFPELRQLLLDVFTEAPEGTEHVITRFRLANTNLRTMLERYITRAGEQKWPRLFHNLRATRATELSRRFPIQTVVAWMGHTEQVALDHYLQTNQTDFAKALAEQAPATDIDASSAAQNAAQQPSESVRNDGNATPAGTPETAGFPDDSDDCELVQIEGMGALGFEPRTKEL